MRLAKYLLTEYSYKLKKKKIYDSNKSLKSCILFKVITLSY